MKASAPLALTLSLLLSSAVMADEPVPNDNLKLATGEPERCLGITRISPENSPARVEKRREVL